MTQGKVDTSSGRDLRGPGSLPVVIAGPDGIVVDVNDVGRTLLPDLAAGTRLAHTVPSWLIDAHDRALAGTGDVADGRLGERSVAAHPVRLGDDVAWWLVDTTAEEELRLERKRTEFLATASSALLASLNINAEQVLRDVDDALAAHPALRELHIDCAGLEICDSRGLSVLLMLRRRAESLRIRLYIVNRPKTLDRLLLRTGTAEYLTGEKVRADRQDETSS